MASMTEFGVEDHYAGSIDSPTEFIEDHTGIVASPTESGGYHSGTNIPYSPGYSQEDHYAGSLASPEGFEDYSGLHMASPTDSGGYHFGTNMMRPPGYSQDHTGKIVSPTDLEGGYHFGTNMTHQTGYSQENHIGSIASPTESDGGYYSGMSLTRQQIREHNQKVGWQQWITLKGNVYHTTGFRDHFIAYNKKKAADQTLKQSPDCEHKELSNCELSLESPECEHKRGSPDQHILTDDSPHWRSACTKLTNAIDDLVSQNNSGAPNENNNTLKHNDSDDGSDDDDDDDSEDEESEEENDSEMDDFEWKYNVIAALHRSGLSMAEIENEIRPFKIGTLQNPALPTWKYWENIRADVIALHDEISQKDSSDIGRYEQEYLSMLQTWLRKYRDIDPTEKKLNGDGNTNVFFFTQDPDSFRDWLPSMPILDTDLPQSGAWASKELLLSPLGDTHDVFSAALRAHNSDIQPFRHDIEGDVAWKELPEEVISNDLMTPEQQCVHEARVLRGSGLHDPVRMKRRREQLGRYFMKNYDFSEEEIAEFLQWATLMEQNQRDLEDLC